MTMPNEELRAVKRTREFMRKLLSMTKKDITAMPIKELRDEVYGCLKHYPADYVLDELWAERIKHELD